MTHRYYRRPWDESRGDAFDSWGRSLWYFGVDDDGYPVRQVERYENGRVLKYDDNHVEDACGALGDQPLDPADFVTFEITAGDLQVRYYYEERGSPRPPARRSQRAAVADDPASWLARPGSEVSAALAGSLAGARADRPLQRGGARFDNLVATRGATLARLSVRGIALGNRVRTLRELLGAPTKEGAGWLRFDDEAVALHFEVAGGAVSRITLMTVGRLGTEPDLVQE